MAHRLSSDRGLSSNYIQKFVSDCGCYLTGTNGDSTCDSDSSCTCTIGYMGSKCYYCDNGFYRSDSGFECIGKQRSKALNLDNQKTATDCACLDGSLICDSNGICTCTTGFSGDKCNECASDFTGSACDECVSGLFMVQGICSGTCIGIATFLRDLKHKSIYKLYVVASTLYSLIKFLFSQLKALKHVVLPTSMVKIV